MLITPTVVHLPLISCLVIKGFIHFIILYIKNFYYFSKILPLLINKHLGFFGFFVFVFAFAFILRLITFEIIVKFRRTINFRVSAFPRYDEI